MLDRVAMVLDEAARVAVFHNERQLARQATTTFDEAVHAMDPVDDGPRVGKEEFDPGVGLEGTERLDEAPI